jgi:hypothetical protein
MTCLPDQRLRVGQILGLRVRAFLAFGNGFGSTFRAERHPHLELLITSTVARSALGSRR